METKQYDESTDKIPISGDLDHVYKSCEKNWIVCLQPVEGTITNVGRDNVVDLKYAKFRGNKFMVVGIQHKYDPSLITTSIASRGYYKKSLVYTIGEIVEVEDYNMNKNIVCTTGIHFFLTREAAFSYEKPADEYFEQLSGVYTTYHDNGNKSSETTYENGKLHGPYVSYHDNGNKITKSTYKNGQLHGYHAVYARNGYTSTATFYRNGKRNGSPKACRTPYPEIMKLLYMRDKTMHLTSIASFN
jgi:antitoxin component YwqK of YwqJK toxin-antitoxin module